MLAALSTFASKHFGTADIAPMHSVIDLAPGGYVKNGSVSTGQQAPPGSKPLARRDCHKLLLDAALFWRPVKRKDKPEYASRKKCDYDAAFTFVKLSHEELIMVAATMA
jgi:hypothetical protein